MSNFDTKFRINLQKKYQHDYRQLQASTVRHTSIRRLDTWSQLEHHIRNVNTSCNNFNELSNAGTEWSNLEQSSVSCNKGGKPDKSED